MRHKWTEEEDKILIENKCEDIKNLEKLLNRTISSIRNRLNKLKLSPPIRVWTDLENSFLIDNYKALSIIEMAHKLNRTYHSTRMQLQRLCLKKLTGLATEYPELCNAWSAIIQRCTNPNNTNYHNYGGRGISVCEEWSKLSYPFIEWSLNNGWKQGLSIDRIDVNGNYEPNNCRWVDNLCQQNNRRDNILMTAFGETKTLKEWSRDSRSKVCYSTLTKRYHAGNNTPEEILTKESRKHKKYANNKIS